LPIAACEHSEREGQSDDDLKSEVRGDKLTFDHTNVSDMGRRTTRDADWSLDVLHVEGKRKVDHRVHPSSKRRVENESSLGTHLWREPLFLSAAEDFAFFEHVPFVCDANGGVGSGDGKTSFEFEVAEAAGH
jgi:hypothetical protein